MEKRKRLPSSIKHDPSTLLLLPNDSTPNVLQRLQNMPEVDPQGLGIKRHVPFPSGALLVSCSSAAQAEQIRNATAKAGIAEKVRKTKLPEFRIHAIPGSTTVEQLQEDLKKRLGNIEAHITLFPYRNTRYAGQLFAVVQTNAEDLKKAGKVKNIRVGWNKCRIDTNIHVTHCHRCGFLGHSEQRCNLMEGPSTAEQLPTGNEKAPQEEIC